MEDRKDTYLYRRYLFASLLMAAMLVGFGLIGSSTLAAPRPLEKAGVLLTATPTNTATPIPGCGPGSNCTVSSDTGVALIPGTTMIPNSQCEDCVPLSGLPHTPGPVARSTSRCVCTRGSTGSTSSTIPWTRAVVGPRWVCKEIL